MSAAQAPAPAAFWDIKGKRKRLTVERHDKGIALVFWPQSSTGVAATIIGFKAARAVADGLLRSNDYHTATDKDFPADIRVHAQSHPGGALLRIVSQTHHGTEFQDIQLGPMQRARLIETIITMAGRG